MYCVLRVSGSRRLWLLAAVLAALQAYPIEAQAQAIDSLGYLPNDYDPSSYAMGISADGKTVVGYGPSAAGSEAFRWQNGVMTGIGGLDGPALNSIAYGVNADGSVVVGQAWSARADMQAFRWEGGTMIGLGFLNDTDINSVAYGVSGDGSVVVGYILKSNFTNRAVRWEGDDIIDLGDLEGGSGNATAYGVSADGKIVVGQSTSSDGLSAFRWEGGTMSALINPEGDFYETTALAISADGKVAVGSGESDDGLEAIRWEGNEAKRLGDFGRVDDFHSIAYAVNGDGSVIVGEGTGPNGAPDAFRWTAATGMESIRALLVAAGVDMTGWTLFTATGVSADGKTIVGDGITPADYSAWIVRLAPQDDGGGDGGDNGITTAAAQQQSVSALANDRFGIMAQQHGFAIPLLGGDKPITNDSEVGIFGMGGSAAGGGYARYSTGDGIAILAGVSYGEEAYQDASIEDSLMGALALRYLAPGRRLWRPFAEIGGWYAPDSRLDFDRIYMNGAGTSIGSGSTEADVSYYYGRAGVVFDFGKREQLAVSGEIGHERLDADGYAEGTPGNPFNAVISSGTDEMDLVKARLAWSFPLAPRVDATLWGAGVYAFNRETDLSVAVSGVGVFAPTIEDETQWIEYGARVGYAVTETVTLDVFVNGVSGNDDISTRVHGGAGLRYRF